jgi:hypothetical protein
MSTPSNTSSVADELVLERLPNGELAWLRPAFQFAFNAAIERVTARYVLTDRGHELLADDRRHTAALDMLFHPTWPTVADTLPRVGA